MFILFGYSVHVTNDTMIYHVYVVLLHCLFHISFSAPKPSAVQPILATKCLDVGKHRHKGAWLWSRGENKCESVGDLDDPVIQEKGITANQVVFTFQVSA